jgi:hypothetical protein
MAEVVSVGDGVLYRMVIPPVTGSLYTSARALPSPAVSHASAISSFCVALAGAHVVLLVDWYCDCAGSPICSCIECSGMFFREA